MVFLLVIPSKKLSSNGDFMKTEKLNVFIGSVTAFFEQLGEALKEIDTPYLNSNQTPVISDYTGLIHITGPLKGAVYVSCPTMLLRELLMVLGEPDTSMALLKDLVGEIANTVAGNARTEFGADFIISPPVIDVGANPIQHLPKERRSYIIPFYWRSHQGLIGICIWNN